MLQRNATITHPVAGRCQLLCKRVCRLVTSSPGGMASFPGKTTSFPGEMASLLGGTASSFGMTTPSLQDPMARRGGPRLRQAGGRFAVACLPVKRAAMVSFNAISVCRHTPSVFSPILARVRRCSTESSISCENFSSSVLKVESIAAMSSALKFRDIRFWLLGTLLGVDRKLKGAGQEYELIRELSSTRGDQPSTTATTRAACCARSK